MVIELEGEYKVIQPDILATLRRATRTDIERVEQLIDFSKMTHSKVLYRRFLVKMYGFYSRLETRLDEVLNPFEKVGFELTQRRKTSALLLDLLSAGLSRKEMDAIELCEDVPEVLSRAQALGALFVLEELLVGGEFVSQLLSQRIGVASRFFQSYGANNSYMANRFSEILAENVSEVALPELIDSAKETCGKLLAWLESPTACFQKCG